MPDGPTAPEGPLPPVTPPTEPKYIVSEEVDKGFENFSQNERVIQLKQKADELYKDIGPEGRERLNREFTGAVFERFVCVSLTPDHPYGFKLLSPEETIEWYKKRYPDRPMVTTRFQTSIAGVNVFDGLLIDPVSGQVVGFCEYTNHAGVKRFPAKYGAYKEAMSLPGVSQEAKLYVLIPKFEEHTERERQIKEEIKKKFDDPDIDKVVKIDPILLTRTQFNKLRQKYEIISPGEK